MDSKEFVKSYTKGDLEEKLSKISSIDKKLSFIYFVISELEAYGIKHIKIRSDSKDRYHGIVLPFEMKSSYQFLKAKRKYFESLLRVPDKKSVVHKEKLDGN